MAPLTPTVPDTAEIARLSAAHLPFEGASWATCLGAGLDRGEGLPGERGKPVVGPVLVPLSRQAVRGAQ
ncbi:hypothetical protein CU044_1022 [Streptomyces sp. L-9-10]|uniref:hypothetical protein n=1 Tax=Streptomyces sp. L-9-10 TaxID=1478131 RepID=UPI00101B6398|nr:hypothetical protein [Streptomyces sp. L-9-10]RYJ30679.1 hypothetical protein CU044_1022 [Streptomyces sp. L-9-10]